MTREAHGMLDTIAALIVLFSVLLDPVLAFWMAIALVLVSGIVHLRRSFASRHGLRDRHA